MNKKTLFSAVMALLLVVTLLLAAAPVGAMPPKSIVYIEAPLYAPVPLNSDELALGDRTLKMVITDDADMMPIVQITQGFSIAPTEQLARPARLALPIVCTREELQHMEPPVLTLDGAEAEYKLYTMLGRCQS